MKSYNSTGFVYGYLWGGGSGSYTAKKLTGYCTKKELIAQAETMLNNGSLDAGMGYESLKGALLYIETVETLTVKNKTFKRSEYSKKYIGNLTQGEKLFLSNNY